MRFSAASVLAFAAAVVAQTSGFDAITSPPSGSSVAAGSTFEIDWEPTTYTNTTDTVSIILLGGKSSGSLEPLSTIASNVKNSDGKYSWSVDSTLGSQAVYGLKIQLDSDPKIFQYSFPFPITGGKSTGSSSTSGSGSSSTTSGSASSTSGASTTSASGSASSTSASTTAAPSSSTSAKTTLSTTISVAGNLSTTGAPTKTQTQVVGVTPTASSTGSVATGAASNVGASSLAFLGGLALAVLAL